MSEVMPTTSYKLPEINNIKNIINYDTCPVAPAVISKISTNQAGGWSIKLDIPESAGEVVKQLIGTENQIVYSIAFVLLCDLPQLPKRKPGRPKYEVA